MPTETLRVTLLPPAAEAHGLGPLLRALHSDDAVVRLRGAHRTMRAWLHGPRQDPGLHAAVCQAHELALAFLHDPDPRLLRPAVALARDLLVLRDEGFLSVREEDEAEAALRDARARVALALALLQGGAGCAGRVERDLTTALAGFEAVLQGWHDDLGSREPTEEGPPGPIRTTPPGVYRVACPPRRSASTRPSFIGRWLRRLRG